MGATMVMMTGARTADKRATQSVYLLENYSAGSLVTLWVMMRDTLTAGSKERQLERLLEVHSAGRWG